MPNAVVTVLVPCRNKLSRLPSLIARFDAMRATGQIPHWEVLFINDGSQDGTGPLLNQLMDRFHWIRVVHHRRARGLGPALRAGLQRSEAAVVCTMECDGAYGPETLPGMVALLEDGADVVTVSVGDPAEGCLLRKSLRDLTNGIAARLYRMLLGGPAHGYCSNHRAYRASALKRISLRSRGESVVAEIMIRCLLKRLRVREFRTAAEPSETPAAGTDLQAGILGHAALLQMSCRCLFARTLTQWVASI
ncbi:MAG: glycosyltransferase family 2 protein [Acidobacteriaceae bacterium]|nr:glycosyltransferase family 2 protein [Acidobacteriaceae bacterium]